MEIYITDEPFFFKPKYIHLFRVDNTFPKLLSFSHQVECRKNYNTLKIYALNIHKVF